MHYVKAFDCNQMMMTTWDSMVNPDSTARLIDAFVNSLGLSDYDVKVLAKEGRPPYDPRCFYKLYIYGSDNGIKSSRKLAKSCKVNIEVKWMLGGVEPDFRTISDFRKDNIDSLKKIFNKFNRRLSGAVNWEIDFTKDCLEKTCGDWLKAEGRTPDKNRAARGKYHFEKMKVVRFFLKPDREKTAERMCLSEHPFGTIKRAMGFTYFLLKGLRKVTGKFALMCLGYNIKRAKNLLGFEKMMGLMAASGC